MIGNGCARELTFHYSRCLNGSGHYSTVFKWIQKIGCWTKRMKMYMVKGDGKEIYIITKQNQIV